MATPTTPKVSAASGSGTQRTAAGSVQEYSIRVPKNTKKKFQVMRFNANLGINLSDWKDNATQIKMERENNMREFKGTEEEIPKFGAGSEFGKEAREEARRKKFGINTKKYKPDNQPWILKMGGKNGKKFKGIREGGVGDNTAYYVFAQAGKGVIEAYPLQEWYKFQPIQRYKALSAEEAEEEFGRRNKIINYFSVMMKKRLKGEDDTLPEELEEGVKGKGKPGSKKKDKNELKISEMDDWVDSDDDGSGSDSDAKKKEDSDDEGPKKKKGAKGKKAAAAKKKKKKKDSDDEAFEESDDGDEEGREMDYISDSSESASDHEMKANKELKGVAEEDALRKLLNSESEDEDENEEKKKEENESNSDDDEKKKDEKEKGDKSKEDGGKKKKKKDLKSKKGKNEKKPNAGKNGDADSSSELSPNSTDTDSDAPPSDKPKVPKVKETANSAASSRSTTPTPVAGEKRKLTNAESAVAAAKKAKLDGSGASSSYIPPSSETGVTEDAVRRYLMRKPMTTKELVHKFKSKKSSNLTSDQLVNLMTQILKNINPVKQMIKNQLYLSLKPT